MKRALLSWAVFFHLLLVLSSCSKQSQDNPAAPSQSSTINATVSPGQAFTFNAGASGTLNISNQAFHYQVSEVTVDNSSGAQLYTYVPAKGYAGSDQVTLTHTIAASLTNEGGCQNHHGNGTTNSELIAIKITVGN